jgi:hypothetical protein
MESREEDVSAFDIAFEANRKEGNTDEPGDDPDAPYYAEHQVATFFEMTFIKKAGLSWAVYEEAVNNLPEWKGKGSTIKKMSPTLKRYIVSSITTFSLRFFGSLALQLSVGAITPETFTISAALSILATAARAGVKPVVELVFGMHADGTSLQ